jgi:hypothetical protein
MKSRINPCVTTFLFITLIAFNSKSQIAISNIKEIEKIKNGTTFIVMKDPYSEKVIEFINAFKSSWTISKLEFIKYEDIQKKMSFQNSFLTFEHYTKTSSDMNNSSVSSTVTHLYLQLWTCDPEYFKKEQGIMQLQNLPKIEVARIELFTDVYLLINPDLIYVYNFNMDGHIYNWGPGIVKNYIQTLMIYLNKNDKRWLYSGIKDKQQLKKLKTDSLYVPHYFMLKYKKMDESRRHKERKLFKHYKNKYVILSDSSLNEKILNSEEAFYYLLYVRSFMDKFICVMNSKTGEMIYSRYTGMSMNAKSKDLKKLQRKINRIKS